MNSSVVCLIFALHLTFGYKALPGLGAINNDDRNVYCDPLNLSHVTEHYLKTKLRITQNPGNDL
jgi:hypothetical protein